ncbi:MAG: hypothetical protein CVU47_07690 [Chloroflexi bacterium HGW-Chloroflexi-9]|nr:MAG: hypothetical protein CVU47_07690 [Chloroflexi bacterium HGW-Chloroflexi-9]
MEKIDIPFFYHLGAAVHPLTETSFQRNRLIEAYVAVQGAQAQLDAIWARLQLTFCRAAAEELRTAMSRSENWLQTPEGQDSPPWGEPLAGVQVWEASQITAKATAFETVLTTELQGLPTYHATRKGIYSMPDLIDNASEIFPPKILGRLSAEAIEEIKQAGRCVAFDNSTASGFHSMRAVESVMHNYYIAICQGDAATKLDSWGAYIAELRKVAETNDNVDAKRVVAMLQQIKDHDRNLIMHPEVVLVPDDALALFEISQGVIMAMAEGLPPLPPSPQPPS